MVDLEKGPNRDSSSFSGEDDNNDLQLHATQSINRPEIITSNVDFIFEDPDEQAALSRIVSHVDPKHLEVNDNDPWKYYIDAGTGARIVEFQPGDPENPLNWSKAKKWTYTLLLGIVCFMVAFASAVVTGDMEGPQETFGVSSEVVILTITLFVIGFGVGPLVFAPLSEEVGRFPVYNVTLAFAVIFIIPCAVAKNIGTLLVCRLIGGVAFSAPITLVGGSLSDIWTTKERGTPMAFFSAAPFLGPVMGPLVGGFIGDNAGWRWLYWVMLIFSGCVYLVTLVSLRETHHATILKQRAKKLRKITGDSKYKTKKELVPQSFGAVMKITLSRPPQLLFEVIVFLVTIYMSVLYGLLYMFFFAYPVVFMEGKGWSASMTGLIFIGVAIGIVIATAAAPFINNDYNRRAESYRIEGKIPPPELRLIPMMISCWCVPVGLFIFAWTSFPHVHWIGPAIAGIPSGIGFLLLYNSANNYIIDSYQHFAASALAAKTFVRSIWGACVPLFTVQMYHRLGYEWAGSLMAFISLACCAIPYLFFFYGATIRKRSKYAYDGE